LNDRFIDGNLIILYALSKTSLTQDGLPDHILNRIKLCVNIHGLIMRSKPDKNRTVIYIVTNLDYLGYVKEELRMAKIGQDNLVVDTKSKNVRQTCDQIIRYLKGRVNPPKIYFVGSTWQRESFESNSLTKLEGHVVQFEGALDSRSVAEIDKENAADAPKKGIQIYKKQAKGKAANLLLNILFQNRSEAKR